MMMMMMMMMIMIMMMMVMVVMAGNGLLHSFLPAGGSCLIHHGLGSGEPASGDAGRGKIRWRVVAILSIRDRAQSTM